MLDLILIIGCICLILHVMRYGIIPTLFLLFSLEFLAEGLTGYWKVILAIVIFAELATIFITSKGNQRRFKKLVYIFSYFE